MPDNMTLDEMQEKLKALGISPGQWRSTGGTTTSPLLERQKENLRKLRGLLVKQVEKDKQQLSDLHAAAQRMKHGGGL